MGDWLIDVIFNEDVFSFYVIGGKEGRYNEHWPKSVWIRFVNRTDRCSAKVLRLPVRVSDRAAGCFDQGVWWFSPASRRMLV